MEDNRTWYDIEDSGQVIGRYAIDEYLPPLRLFVHVEIEEWYRGRIGIRACKRHLRGLFGTYNVEAVYVATHKREGAAFAALCGFTRVGYFPRFCIDGTDVLDSWIYRITNEEADNG